MINNGKYLFNVKMINDKNYKNTMKMSDMWMLNSNLYGFEFHM